MARSKPQQGRHKPQAVNVNCRGSNNTLVSKASKRNGGMMATTRNDGGNPSPTVYHISGKEVEAHPNCDNASEITTSTEDAAATPTDSWLTCMSKTEEVAFHNRQVKQYAHKTLFSMVMLFTDPTELHYTTEKSLCQFICKEFNVQEAN